jgi:acyl-CoA thioesterase FadM
MVTEIKKDPSGSKWLFMRVRTHEIKNGRFDTEVTIVDEGGELVCLSRHVSLVFARKSPDELQRIYRL